MVLRGTEALEAWARRSCSSYPTIKIRNMTSSFKDGLAFCAILHNYHPDLVPEFHSLKPANIRENCELAFSRAEQYLGIPPLLDPEDMAECSTPDRRSILLYLSELYAKLGGQAANSPAASTVVDTKTAVGNSNLRANLPPAMLNSTQNQKLTNNINNKSPNEALVKNIDNNITKPVIKAVSSTNIIESDSLSSDAASSSSADDSVSTTSTDEVSADSADETKDSDGCIDAEVIAHSSRTPLKKRESVERKNSIDSGFETTLSCSMDSSSSTQASPRISPCFVSSTPTKASSTQQHINQQIPPTPSPRKISNINRDKVCLRERLKSESEKSSSSNPFLEARARLRPLSTAYPAKSTPSIATKHDQDESMKINTSNNSTTPKSDILDISKSSSISKSSTLSTSSFSLLNNSEFTVFTPTNLSKSFAQRRQQFLEMKKLYKSEEKLNSLRDFALSTSDITTTDNQHNANSDNLSKSTIELVSNKSSDNIDNDNHKNNKSDENTKNEDNKKDVMTNLETSFKSALNKFKQCESKSMSNLSMSPNNGGFRSSSSAAFSRENSCSAISRGDNSCDFESPSGPSSMECKAIQTEESILGKEGGDRHKKSGNAIVDGDSGSKYQTHTTSTNNSCAKSVNSTTTTQAKSATTQQLTTTAANTTTVLRQQQYQQFNPTPTSILKTRYRRSMIETATKRPLLSETSKDSLVNNHFFPAVVHEGVMSYAPVGEAVRSRHSVSTSHQQAMYHIPSYQGHSQQAVAGPQHPPHHRQHPSHGHSHHEPIYQQPQLRTHHPHAHQMPQQSIYTTLAQHSYSTNNLTASGGCVRRPQQDATVTASPRLLQDALTNQTAAVSANHNRIPADAVYAQPHQHPTATAVRMRPNNGGNGGPKCHQRNRHSFHNLNHLLKEMKKSSFDYYEGQSTLV